MKKANLLMLCLLFLGTTFGSVQIIHASENGPSCTNCTDPSNNITNNGDNTFTAANVAQAYFWEICSGGASIVGSNTGATVTVQPTGISTGSRIRLTRFVNGKCVESCEIFTFPPPSCDNCVTIEVTGNSTGTDCVSAQANLINCYTNVASVAWSWDLYGQCNPGPCTLNTTTTYPFYSSTVDLSSICIDPINYPYLQFFATITYNDGSTCEDWDQVLLTCDNMNGIGCIPGPKGQPEINITPNPARNGDSLSFSGIDYKEISSISILDLSGTQKMEIQPIQQSFTTNNLRAGVYIVKFTTTSGEVQQRKLVIE